MKGQQLLTVHEQAMAIRVGCSQQAKRDKLLCEPPRVEEVRG